MRDDFLSRWSRRKAAARTDPAAPGSAVVPADSDAAQPATAPPATAPAAETPQPLPPVESLTPESDFTPFMKPDVDASTRREALKTLFRDPQFNVMDGLDVYIDDYSKPDPIPEGWLDRMYQTARLGEYLDPEKEALRKELEKEAEERLAQADGSPDPVQPESPPPLNPPDKDPSEQSVVPAPIAVPASEIPPRIPPTDI